MPRPKQNGASEPKRRSRNGCWPCKGRKVKCGEEHPSCYNCLKNGDTCDYSIRLNWESRKTKHPIVVGPNKPNTTHQAEGDDKFQLENEPFLQLSQLAPSHPHAGESFDSDAGVSWFTKHTASARNGVPNPGTTSNAQNSQDTEGDMRHGFTVQQEGPRATSVRRPPGQRGTNVGHDLPLQPTSFGRRLSRRKHRRAASVVSSLDGCPATPVSWSSPKSGTNASPWIPHMAINPVITTEPLTPSTFSSYSDDIAYQFRQRDHVVDQSPGPWCTVGSDYSEFSPLSAPPEHGWDPQYHAEHQFSLGPAYWEAGRFYGYDLCKPDDDIVKNDDANAISRVFAGPSDLAPGSVEPLETLSITGLVGDIGATHASSRDAGDTFGAVPVLIPWELEPLPEKLQSNPMNLLYFHHFLEHTAKALVPYHDPDSNPFRTILPQLAVGSDHLLSLMLAYSASHRARLMGIKEPSMRMAEWVEDIFPALRAALSEPQQLASIADMATAILLTSLEISSPGTFGSSIPWQQHLGLSRNMMTQRLKEMSRTGSAISSDRTITFLWSWLAYLDVLAGLSMGPRDGVSSLTWLQTSVVDMDLDQLSCVMGFTKRAAYLLSQVAELGRHSDASRVGSCGRVWPDWVVDAETAEKARKLEKALLSSLEQPAKPCRHLQNSLISRHDTAEMGFTNKAFHWASLVHLHRRALGKPSSHGDVQGLVGELLACLQQIRPGGAGESKVLHPLFIAGCETIDMSQRALVLSRLKSMEKGGMAQVQRARALMEKSGEQSQPWEMLAQGEFLG